MVKCKSGKTLKARTFSKLLEGPEIESEMPESATASVEYGDVTLSVGLLGYQQVSIEVRPSNRAFALRAIQSVTAWSLKSRRSRFWYFFQEYGGPIAFSLFSFLVILFAAGLDISSIGKSDLESRAKVLSENGIDGTSQFEAIDILLRLATRNYEGKKFEGLRPWYKGYLAFVAGWLVLTVAAPRSTIGIGRAERRMAYYRTFGKLGKYVIGVWFVAVAASVVGAGLYEYLKELIRR